MTFAVVTHQIVRSKSANFIVYECYLTKADQKQKQFKDSDKGDKICLVAQGDNTEGKGDGRQIPVLALWVAERKENKEDRERTEEGLRIQSEGL